MILATPCAVAVLKLAVVAFAVDGVGDVVVAETVFTGTPFVVLAAAVLAGTFGVVVVVDVAGATLTG